MADVVTIELLERAFKYHPPIIKTPCARCSNSGEVLVGNEFLCCGCAVKEWEQKHGH